MEYRELADEALMDRFYCGEERAFDELFRRWRGRHYNYVRRRQPSHAGSQDEVAKEIVHKAWLKVAESRERPTARWRPERGRLAPWLWRIVERTSVDEGRKRPRDIATAPEDIPVVVVNDSDDSGVATVLEACIARLPHDDRRLLHEKFFLCSTQKEIAAAMGRTESWVSRALHDVYARLRACMQKELGS
jgi:RNA polymerase sigma factor (sigma-70 family)